MVWQAGWGAQLFVITNINELSACSLVKEEYYGEAMGGWLEQLYGPYYFLVSAGSVFAVICSAWRCEREQKKVT